MKIRFVFMALVAMLLLAARSNAVAYSPVGGQDISFNFTIQPLNINGEGAQFAPAFYQNGIVFCSSKRDNLRFGTAAIGNDLALYYAAQNTDKTFKTPQKMKGAGMGGYEAGPAYITPDFKHIVFSRNKNKSVKDESATWGLYFADLTASTEWGEAEHFVHNFNQFDVQQPCLSPDGRILYFVSDLPGGVGGTDIYMCYKIGNTWSRPENLGSRVNSIYNESFPYVAADGALYYASAGFDNGDGVDIFYTRKIAGEWLNPQKLPAPVNSAKDDFSFILSLNQSGSGYGYFASDRNGNTDLFSFSVTVYSEPEFAGIQPGNADVAVARSVSNEGQFVSTTTQPIGKKVMLNGIIGMNKLFFPQGRWHILPETARELDKLVAYMLQNPRLSVEISVHTDSRGDDDANLQLSSKRANAVQVYLVSKQIDGSRITALGYGETQLLNYCRNGMNCSDDMHNENNRVEVRATPESEFTVNWGANYSAASMTQQPAPDQPVSRGLDVQSAANGKLYYKITVGPFDRIDNRTFYECRQLDLNLSYEDSPKGKLVVLGPYESMQEAYRNKAYLEARGIQRTQVNSMSASSLTRYEPATVNNSEEETSDADATYELHIGPFKHVDNNTYHRFANLGTPIHIEYTTKGMMIVLGPYKTMSEVEEYKAMVKERVSSNKTKVQVFNDGEQVLESKKAKHKRRK
ncbi:OmpA family protein [Sphingobacteriales bacterium UPWRP_1]|nr:hypothetical protein B6N25_15975 [Sphingobacteriales bacterium TSM_CSS]PSJ74083.1 OmpA family protein [Sphingobacteriales bacterium UPWRP_1]